MAQIPGVHVETLHNPVHYSGAQIENACRLAGALKRGRLVLCERPAGDMRERDETG